jgi:FkbM family methyltransferase
VTDLHRIQALRRLALPLLARFGDRDITMRHAWHPEHRVRLNLYRHKGYWFHGKRREIELMGSLQRLLRPGDSVVEVGCHIGWISLHILKLLKEGGKLFAFEPSPKNLPYLEVNLANFANVEIVRAAVSNRAGEADFFIESLTGQNDTLVQAYSVFEDNKSQAYSDATYEKVRVRTVTLDDYFSDESRPFSLIKIDVEGAERLVLEGGAGFLERHRPVIALEVTREAEWVARFLGDAGYTRFTEALQPVGPGALSDGNWIFVPAERGVPLSSDTRN